MGYQAIVQRFYDEKRGSNPSLQEANSYLFEEVSEADSALEEVILASRSIGPCPNDCAECECGGRYLVRELAKELADVMFTLYGVAIAAGIDLDRAFELVAESNLTKDFTPAGKVRKGESYREPEMSGALL